MVVSRRRGGGRCSSCPFLLPVVCLPDTRRVEFLLLATRFSGIAAAARARGSFRRVPKLAPSQRQTAAALGMERGEALVIVGCGQHQLHVILGGPWASVMGSPTVAPSIRFWHVHLASMLVSSQCARPNLAKL